MRFNPLKIIIITALLILPGGCAHTESAKFYVLNSLTGSNAVIKPEAGHNKLTLGIGPINLPEYLDRPQIMTRTGGNELEYTEFHQWAEPLKDNFARVLGENLSVLMDTNRIHQFPWRRSAEIDYQLTVDVINFDGNLEGNSVLTVRWTLYGKDRDKALILQKSTFKQAATGKDYQAMVSALNKTLEQFSRDVENAIHSLISPQSLVSPQT
jgi:uncharacterized lipoprotein YmbA